MGRTACPKGIFQKREHFLHTVVQLPAGKLELTSKRAHILAGGRQQIHATSGELFGLGLRELAPLTYEDAVFEPARERMKELAIIDGGRGQIEYEM